MGKDMRVITVPIKRDKERRKSAGGGRADDQKNQIEHALDAAVLKLFTDSTIRGKVNVEAASQTTHRGGGGGKRPWETFHKKPEERRASGRDAVAHGRARLVGLSIALTGVAIQRDSPDLD